MRGRTLGGEDVGRGEVGVAVDDLLSLGSGTEIIACAGGNYLENERVCHWLLPRNRCWIWIVSLSMFVFPSILGGE